MAFKYGTTSPTEIIYNGTSLTVLKYGENAVWGKPYSLSISQGENTTVTVNRTSSPNQQAELGVLSDGSVIYYGDVLLITYSVDDDYEVNAHSINGQNLNNGQSVTVTESLEIVVTAIASYSWHLIWSGSKDVTTNTTITTFDHLPFKYKASVTTTNEFSSYEYSQTLELEVDTEKTVYGKWETGGGDVETEPCGTFKITQTISGLSVTANATFSGRTGENDGDPYSMKITRLEVYY